jgi:hypothetical protein
MTQAMTASVLTSRREGADLLIAHYSALSLAPPGPPARDRLDEALGNDMARRLVAALTPRRTASG